MHGHEIRHFGFDSLHVLIGKAEMVTYFMDEHMRDQMT
jgi:hypothetical protein